MKTYKDLKRDLKEVKTVFVYVRLNEHYGDYFKVSKKEVSNVLKLNPHNDEVTYTISDDGHDLYID